VICICKLGLQPLGPGNKLCSSRTTGRQVVVVTTYNAGPRLGDTRAIFIQPDPIICNTLLYITSHKIKMKRAGMTPTVYNLIPQCIISTLCWSAAVYPFLCVFLFLSLTILVTSEQKFFRYTLKCWNCSACVGTHWKFLHKY
jgi:hypothetical protein